MKQCINYEEYHGDNGDIELSLVIPCYNEEAVLPVSIPPLLNLCQKSNLKYEIILVNNGSWDATPRVIDSFIAQGYPVKRVDVPVNQGYGWGIICGLKVVRGKYIGYMGADGQIQAEDVMRTWQKMREASGETVVKGKRINRADGPLRRSVSWVFNTLFVLLYGPITRDVNGTPKFFYREHLPILNLTSKGSFLDAELLIKAHALRFDIIEVPVTFYPRQGGASTVRVMSKSWEFFKDMIQFRYRNGIKIWLNEIKPYEQ